MVIYDKEKGTLYVPENDDRVLFDPQEVYNRGFALGYEDGYRAGEEECQNA